MLVTYLYCQITATFSINNQAKEISQVPITVIPTKSIPQGISALISFNGEESPEENERQMNETIKEVKSGQVTYAIRDTSYNSVGIKRRHHWHCRQGYYCCRSRRV